MNLREQNLFSKCCQSLEQKLRQQRSQDFPRGTVSICRSKGCKVKGHQDLWMIQLYGTQTRTAIVRLDLDQAAELFF